MANLSTTDFLYGAIISNLLNNKTQIALLEADGNRRRKYRISTDKRDFILLAKYSKHPQKRKGDGFVSWQFQLGEDIEELENYLKAEQDFSLGLVCCVSDTPKMSKSAVEQPHIIYLRPHEVREIIAAEKGTFTVRYNKQKRNYIIPMRENKFLQIRTTRMN